jgi:hypothetical protein
MCMECWEKKGSPSIVNEKTKAAAELIAEVYNHHNSGGYLHIVVDDWNIDYDSIAWCQNYIKHPVSYHERTPEQIEAELACVNALLELTEDEVGSALAIHDGFVKAEP